MSVTDKTSIKPTVAWDEIDKYRFFSIGTGMYSGLTILLHPITVIKVRQQVLDDATNEKPLTTNNDKTKKLSKENKNINHHHHHPQPTTLRTNTNLHETIQPKKTVSMINKWKGFYRGLPTVLTIAVPSRALYITVLEESRTKISNALTYYCTDTTKSISYLTLSGTTIQTLSGGIAGGLAAMVAQLCVVPMDVVSQKQMISNKHIPAMSIVQDILSSKEGWRGLYKGFGISIFNSLPTGIVWWGTYGGTQQYLFLSLQSNSMKPKNFITHDGDSNTWNEWIKTGLIQIGSGISAAVVASVLTQPLDVIKTRLQVMGPATSPWSQSKTNSSSISTVIKELAISEGIQGFFRGTGPRILYMGLWGTILSSAFEYLKIISRKE